MPQGHYRTTTLIGAVKLAGPHVLGLVNGAMDGALFLAWVKQGLVPGLPRGDVVILDNLSSHTVAGVREAGDRQRGSHQVQRQDVHPPQ